MEAGGMPEHLRAIAVAFSSALTLHAVWTSMTQPPSVTTEGNTIGFSPIYYLHSIYFNGRKPYLSEANVNVDTVG